MNDPGRQHIIACVLAAAGLAIVFSPLTNAFSQGQDEIVEVIPSYPAFLPQCVEG